MLASANLRACREAVRACRRDDLPAVASLYEAVMRSGGRDAPPLLAAYFERTLFDCPWADADIPSLVYEDARGRLLGFLGSHVRRLRVDGRSVRIACSGQLVADPEARGKPVGALLMAAYLRGPQAATFTDGANAAARRLWEACGGETVHLKTFSWTRVLRPARHGAERVLRRLGRPALARWLPALPRSRLPSVEALDARATIEHMPLMSERLQAFPDYDEPYLEWLFREMAALRSRGRLVRALVRDERGTALGWYVYYLQRGVSRVFQVAARRGAHAQVLDAMLAHARAHGAAAVEGRVEPQLAAALAARRCRFAWSGSTLVHSPSAALLAILLSSGCWLGLMDGESWMGHHRERF